eukprot:comp21514_c0_seq1/m.46984 comp21514_c0_seq1/g.46984  ORF comp21514_c0_seq1/g.46984 comp21514_c0_seq1/m.46984 type:complete len:443 (+) comp21514_c0_seq1:1574-2902(+)
MLFKVELIHPHRKPVLLARCLCELEKVARGATLQLDQSIAVVQALALDEHLVVGPASAIAPAVEEHGLVCHFLVAEMLDAVDELLGLNVGDIGVCGREVGQHARAIESFPEECVVRHLVELIPAQLLREKVLDSGTRADLRELRGISKRVRQPESVRVAAKVGHEEALSQQELAHKTLATGDVAVHLDPGAANGHKATETHLLEDLGPELWIVLPHPFKLLGLRCCKDILVIALHEPELCREAARALAHGLAHGPEPSGVDVAVADGDGELLRSAVGALEELIGQRKCGIPCLWVVEIDHIDHLVADGDGLARAQCVFVQVCRDSRNQLEVKHTAPCLALKGADVRNLELKRALQIRRSRPDRTPLVALPDAKHVGARELDPQGFLFSSDRVAKEHNRLSAVVARAAKQALERSKGVLSWSAAPHECFACCVKHKMDFAMRP